MESPAKRHVLFYCATTFQLFNILNMSRSGNFTQDTLDIIIDNASPLETYIPVLEETKIFNRIYTFDYLGVTEQLRKADKLRRTELSRSPDQVIRIDWESEPYTDFYLANNWLVHKMVYYALVQKGSTPLIHLFEDGTATYSITPAKYYLTEGIDHDFYQAYAFPIRLSELLLYQPELFTGEVSCPVKRMPTLDLNSTPLRLLYEKVWGRAQIPRERYIFFEEASLQDKYPCNDFELFEIVAEKVGRNNIIVKRHPRNRYDRFTPAGYRVMENETIPWEVVLLQNDISNKVLITLTSGAVMTPQLIFNKPIPSIHLVNMMQGNTPTTFHESFLIFMIAW